MQKAEKRIRVRAQLVDAINGRHLWAESYDRSLEDIFALQDEITKKVITSLQVELTMGEYARAVGKSTQSLEALELYWRANYHLLRGTKEDNSLSRKYAEKAVEIDPGFSAAWAELGFTHNNDSMQGWSSSREQSVKSAEGCAQKALSLNPSELKAFLLLCWISLNKREHDKAIEYAEKALEVNPNDPRAYTSLGIAMRAMGRFEEAIANARKAMRLTPFYPVNTLNLFAYSSYHLRRYDDAVSAGEKLLERCRKGEFPEWHGYLLMVVIYSELGQEERARKYATELLNASPNWNLETWKRSQFYKNQSDLDRLINAARKAGLPDKPALPLPDKPSIAVLPFVNMSDDKSQEYFSDGLTEEIITALSKTPKLFVIARNSSFVYKGKPVNIQQVSRELGVKHVLEGSVRRSGDQLRITAQLIEAPTGKHLWSERYERPVGEIFAVQDDITLAIVRAMRVTLTSGEQARLTGKGTKSLEAYLKTIEANEQFHLMNRQGSLKAKELAKEAIALDPRYAYPHAILANAHMLDVWFRFSESPEESMRLADHAAHTALVLEKDDPYVLSALTNVYVMQRQYEKAIASAERALDLSPGSARSQGTMATALMFACRFDEAIPFHQDAVRLDPYPPGMVFRWMGSAYAAVGRLDEALRTYQKALAVNPTDIFTHLGLAMVYVELGREEEARGEAKEVLRLHPKFSLEHYAKAFTFKDQAFVDRRIELLRKAGLN